MPAKLIICCAGRPAINGHKRRTFIWNDKFGCFVHEGRVLDATEFNAKAQEVMAKNQDLRCFARVVESDGDAGPDPRLAELEKSLADKQARVETLQASVLALRTKNAPTLEEAIAIVEARAPDRLKKKPGRKPESLD